MCLVVTDTPTYNSGSATESLKLQRLELLLSTLIRYFNSTLCFQNQNLVPNAHICLLEKWAVLV